MNGAAGIPAQRMHGSTGFIPTAPSMAAATLARKSRTRLEWAHAMMLPERKQRIFFVRPMPLHEKSTAAGAKKNSIMHTSMNSTGMRKRTCRISASGAMYATARRNSVFPGRI